ncbi:MAG TPA: GNAT family N-acetyltransferase [Methanocella sp.]|uniref:GNAT family N-acetyltransferase n=1 Tax=Methanocella sp. TaxID=2052833 RepID=UPI002B979033|nr:GNAT family N-acetyltransferase [Methanocella sp.]HTY90361.1 GNAT family N-acetyltransferase [Methanocella sp.]
MLVRNAFPADFVDISDKSKDWADIVIERESIYHIFTEHFRSTCFIAEDRGEMIGYLLGFRSGSRPDEALIHLIQVAPRLRGNGIGRRMFSQFQAEAKKMGCKRITTHSRPENNNCNRFYKAMGFETASGENPVIVNGMPCVKDYTGPGKHRVVWVKNI